jgi:hypothetical protein
MKFVRATIVAVKKKSYLFRKCVFVALGTQLEMRMRHIVIVLDYKHVSRTDYARNPRFYCSYQTSGVSFISSPEMVAFLQQQPESADTFLNIFRVRSKDIRNRTTFSWHMTPWNSVVGSRSFVAT